jgi:hypothetical protein
LLIPPRAQTSQTKTPNNKLLTIDRCPW